MGSAARIYISLQWRPGLIGYPDSGVYLLDAFAPSYPFYDPLRVDGYGVLIEQVKWHRARN